MRVSLGPEVTVRPRCADWPALLARGPRGVLAGLDLDDWRRRTRRELGLDDERPIVGTGHQTLLWHPGILAKYLLVDAMAEAHGFARANLVVDQHAGGFGSFEVPVRAADDTLAVRRVVLTRARPEVPMSRHEAFVPDPLPARIRGAAPGVEPGIARMHAAVDAHRDAPHAAAQMSRALDDLMRPWIAPIPSATATELLETTLGRAVVEAMVRDPETCARRYNDAVAAMPEAGIARLIVRDDYVELPLWRLRPDGRRMHAYDGDAERWLEDPATAPTLMPRALMLTTLVRLGMCDLFVHGTGGASYDRVMERWIEAWLGFKPAPLAVATADLRLPLGAGSEPGSDAVRDPQEARIAARRIWHDPEGGSRPGPVKRELLDAINAAPFGSAARRRAFLSLHRELATLRSAHIGRVEQAQRAALRAERAALDAAITSRRDWAFPLYEAMQIDELAAAMKDCVRAACA